MERRPTGSPVFDELLQGGYEKGIITTVYGPAGSGKSNLMLLALTTVETKAVFIDTEGSFSVDRLSQLAPGVEGLLDRIIVLKVSSFEQQCQVVERLPAMMKGVELVIVDGIATQYRAALARNVKDVNNELSKQVNTLHAVAADNDIPVLMTSQVYADLEGDGVKVVGGDIVKYYSKCLVELQNDDGRAAIVTKSRFLPPDKRCGFFIDNVGIHESA